MVSIVIPNFNGRFILEDCLESIDKSSQKPKEIIVVDNGSTDDSLLFLKLNYQKVKVIKNTKNLGFAAAVNQGVKKSSSNWVAVVNNDVVLDKNWLKEIQKGITKYKQENVGCFCGLVFDKAGKKIEGQGLEYHIYGKAGNIGNGTKFQKLNDKENYVFGSSGAAAVYNKKALSKAGWFDNNFFAYLEDVDLSLRLQANGFKTVFLPKAVSFHKGGATSHQMGNLRERKTFENWFYIFIKSYPLKVILNNFPAICLERGKTFYDLVRTTPIYKLPIVSTITFLKIMLKSPKMIGKRNPIDDKLLERLTKQ
jgi:GT2 family glycosyltransferase